MKFTKLDHKRLEEIATRIAACKPFTDDNPEKQENRRKLARNDGWNAFNFFAKTYFPHVIDLEFAPAHRFMFQVVEKSSGVTAITGFRGLGKSAMFGYIYPIWKIIKDEKYVIFGAANIEQAIEKIDFIAFEFENNNRLINDFPFLKIKEKDENVFFLKNNTKIRAVSIKQTIRGTINSRSAKRPGLIILDDIDEETNIANITIGKRKKEKIIHEIRGALAPLPRSGKVLWLGNLTHPNFAICQFKKQIIDEINSHKMATINSQLSTENNLCLYGDEKRLIQIPLEKNGKSLWEQQYPTEILPKLRNELGSVGYQREMLGKDIIDGVIFKAHWFINDTFPNDKDFNEVHLYIDPAWGKKGCYKAIFAIAKHNPHSCIHGTAGGKFYVLKAWCRQCENSKMFEYLYHTVNDIKNRFGARARFAFEANFGQKRIMDDFDTWCYANGLAAMSYLFKPINNTENKNLRIEALETIIESGKIIFPHGQDMPTVIAQFTSYPQGYIDAPDAFAGCLERFTGFRKKKGIRIRGLSRL